MNQLILFCMTFVLVLTATILPVTDSNVYTSSQKIHDMVLHEERILNNLYKAIDDLNNQTAMSFFSSFYRDRLSKIERRPNEELIRRTLKHPNGVYQNIKEFASDYQTIRSALGSLPSSTVEKYLSSIASEEDVAGARRSFLRLQAVYSLHTSDMITGNYLGFMGPQLSGDDALEIGHTAITEGEVSYAISWLQEALSRAKAKEPTAGIGIYEDVFTGRILALLGRAYVREGNTEKATEMYIKARDADASDVQVLELERELQSPPKTSAPIFIEEEFKRLCSLQSKTTLAKFDRRLNCTYREVKLPYYRFKQELVSITPYVALFYDVITDAESDSIIDKATDRLTRGNVSSGDTFIPEDSRTSDISFINDEESPVIKRISKRVGAITNLAIQPYQKGGTYFSEPFQVVNYGMGGQYLTHHDEHDEESMRGVDRHIIKYGGNRLATFLIYLSDVERGGSTVFPLIDVAVSPVKKMAVFWYGSKPSGDTDVDTLHGGCPVVIGQKWVSNKWIWTYGNTFTRRCGLKRTATQLDIDHYMRTGWV